MRAHRVSFLLTILVSLCLTACFGGKGSGGGKGGGGNGGGGNAAAVFQISVTHTGNFQQGQGNATYTVTVTNIGNAATSGNAQAIATVPSGETLVSGSGSGWSFPGGPVATRSDSLAPGQSWPPIFVTVNVAGNAASPQVFMVSVSGGGASNTATASDSTTIISAVSLLFDRFAFLFSGFGPNGIAVAATGSINVDANGNVTGEEDFKDAVTLHAAAPILGSCQNYPIASTGFCKLTAAGTTYQYDFVLRNNQLVARFFENPIDGTGITGSGILIAQQIPSSNALTSPGGFNGFFSVEFVGTDAEGARMGVEGNIFTNLSAAIAAQNGFLPQADVNDGGTLIEPPPLASNITGNFTPFPGPPTVDASGRATMTMTVGTSPSSETLTLALYILAPQAPLSNQSGRAFAIDITAASKQVLSGQFFWLGPPPLNLTIDNSNFPVNVFALWGVTPGSPASSSTQIGTFNGTTGQLLFDSNDAGKFNGGNPPQSGAQAGMIGTPISVAPNGRAILSVTVNGTASTYILYLDAVSDGNLLGATVGGANDTKVSFGFFTGQAPTNRFDNTRITGTYIVGTANPVLPGVPNGASPITLTPTGQSGSGATLTFSGNFAAGATNGSYSFVQMTGRGTAVGGSGKLFQNANIVFYIITPNLMVVMGADPNVTNDAIGLIQF